MYLKKKKQIQILETASSEIKKESLNRSGLVPVSQYNAIMQSNVLYIFKRILKIVWNYHERINWLVLVLLLNDSISNVLKYW